MKNLLNLGKALNKAEQKNVFGGTEPLRREGDNEDCNYEHHDVCSDGSPCDPWDSNSCGAMSSGCGHWVVVCN